MAPKVRRGHCSRTLRVSPVGIVARSMGHETVGEREETDLADRWVRPCTLAPLHSLASEMPLTGVQYREKFVEETHRIIYQCTRDELRLWSYIMYRGKISRFMDREYIVG